MDLEYNLKLNEAKKQYYKKEIAELKKSDPKKMVLLVEKAGVQRSSK